MSRRSVREPPTIARRSRPPATPSCPEPEWRHSILALQQAAGKPRLGAATAVEAAKSALKASIGGKTASACKARLVKRFPKGPLFTNADVLNIQVLENKSDGANWLKEVGIGDSYSHGRRNRSDCYRHKFLMPLGSNGVNKRDGQRGSDAGRLEGHLWQCPKRRTLTRFPSRVQRGNPFSRQTLLVDGGRVRLSGTRRTPR